MFIILKIVKNLNVNTEFATIMRRLEISANLIQTMHIIWPLYKYISKNEF